MELELEPRSCLQELLLLAVVQAVSKLGIIILRSLSLFVEDQQLLVVAGAGAPFSFLRFGVSRRYPQIYIPTYIPRESTNRGHNIGPLLRPQIYSNPSSGFRGLSEV